MKKVTSFLMVALLAFAPVVMGMAKQPTSNTVTCESQYYQNYGTNARLMWWNVTRGVLPMTNAEAIDMWENNIVVYQSSSRDYSADIALLTAAIDEAETLDSQAQAKNPRFNVNKFEDKPDLYWACKNGN